MISQRCAPLSFLPSLAIAAAPSTQPTPTWRMREGWIEDQE